MSEGAKKLVCEATNSLKTGSIFYQVLLRKTTNYFKECTWYYDLTKNRTYSTFMLDAFLLYQPN